MDYPTRTLFYLHHYILQEIPKELSEAFEKSNVQDKLKNFPNHIRDRFNLNQNYKILMRVRSVDESILSKYESDISKVLLFGDHSFNYNTVLCYT